MTATHLCEICGWGFREKENLVRHRRSHARAIQAGAAAQKCKFCGQGFVNNKILMRHIIVNHEAQQMAFIEKSLQSAGVEKSSAATGDCSNIDPVKPEEAVVTFAKKPVTLPHLLAPGFFHPTLKQSPGITAAEKEPKLRARNIVITNSAALKDSDYTIKLPEDGSRVVKIITSRKKVESVDKRKVADDEFKSTNSAQDITDSLDKMLEEFEEEEEEEKRREAIEGVPKTESKIRNTDKEPNKVITTEVQKSETPNSTALNAIKEILFGVTEHVEEQPPCEADYLSFSIKDELLINVENCEYRNKKILVKDSEVVGRMSTGEIKNSRQVWHDPYKEESDKSVVEKFSRFWTDLGLTPKAKLTRPPAAAPPAGRKRKTPSGKGGSLTVSAKKFCSPVKTNICMKKFPSIPNMQNFQSVPNPKELPTIPNMKPIPLDQSEETTSTCRSLTTKASQESDQKCGVCGKTFPTYPALLAHLTLVSCSIAVCRLFYVRASNISA